MGKKKQIIYILALLAIIAIGMFGYSFFLPKKHFRLQTYQVDTGQWAYKIYQKDRMLIDQNTIPGGSGETAFPTEEQASAIGTLVVKKLEYGEFPPIVTKEDLIKHKVVTP